MHNTNTSGGALALPQCKASSRAVACCVCRDRGISTYCQSPSEELGYLKVGPMTTNKQVTA